MHKLLLCVIMFCAVMYGLNLLAVIVSELTCLNPRYCIFKGQLHILLFMKSRYFCYCLLTRAVSGIVNELASAGSEGSDGEMNLVVKLEANLSSTYSVVIESRGASDCELIELRICEL